LESERQTVVAEDVCLKRMRCEKIASPKEAPKTVKEDCPVVTAHAGAQAMMTGAEYDAKEDELPTVLTVTNTGRMTPLPETNMAAMQESDSHLDTATADAKTRSAGLG
jgi:hypothetical protein